MTAQSQNPDDCCALCAKRLITQVSLDFGKIPYFMLIDQKGRTRNFTTFTMYRHSWSPWCMIRSVGSESAARVSTVCQEALGVMRSATLFRCIYTFA